MPAKINLKSKKSKLFRPQRLALKRAIAKIPKFCYPVFCLACYVVITWLMRRNHVPESNQYFRPLNTFWKQLAPGEKVQEIVCSYFSNDCYGIVDKEINEDVFIRYLYSEQLGYGGYLTNARFIELKLDKTIVEGPHAKAQLLGGYLTGSLGNWSQNESVLIIGLGGGTMNNFLTTTDNQPKVVTIEIDPTIVYIAEKWFDCRPSDDQEILTTDALVYIKDRKVSTDCRSPSSFKKCPFDVIYLDAAYTEPGNPWSAPLKQFFDPEVLKDVKRSLKPDGTVITNVVTTNYALGEKILKKPHDAFSKLFKSCFYLNLNFVLICTDRSLRVNSYPAYDDLFNKVPREIQKRLGHDVEYQPYPVKGVEYL